MEHAPGQGGVGQPAGGRISRGFRLVAVSWGIVRSEKELLVYPLISFICTAVIAGLLVAGALAAGGAPPSGGNSLPPVDYVFMAVGYFAASFVAVFFNAAVAAVAMIKLQGGDPTIRDGFRLAMSKLPKILAWAAVTATVGLVIRTLEERAGIIQRIVLSVIGVAWAAVTFFVVPVLLYEPLGVFESVKRSARIFKGRWGEQFIGNASIGLALFVVAIPVALVAVVLWTVAPALGIAVGVLGFGLLLALGGALSGVFNAALYRYATTGEALGGFSGFDLQDAFRPKRRLLG